MQEFLHVFFPEVQLSEVSVVSAASYMKVFGVMASPDGERDDVIKLPPLTRRMSFHRPRKKERSASAAREVALVRSSAPRLRSLAKVAMH